MSCEGAAHNRQAENNSSEMHLGQLLGVLGPPNLETNDTKRAAAEQILMDSAGDIYSLPILSKVARSKSDAILKLSPKVQKRQLVRLGILGMR